MGHRAWSKGLRGLSGPEPASPADTVTRWKEELHPQGPTAFPAAGGRWTLPGLPLPWASALAALSSVRPSIR